MTSDGQGGRNADRFLNQERKRTGGPKGSGLTPALIEEYKLRGLTQNEIAELHGVSRQTVSQMKRRMGRFSQTPRELVLEKNFPWKVPQKFTQSGIRRMMRNHGEFAATGGKGMSTEKLKRLVSFYRKLTSRNLVVEFDPEIPPNPDSRAGGWRLVPREDSDGDLMIRVNEHTTLTEDGKVIWRIPRQELWPSV